MRVISIVILIILVFSVSSTSNAAEGVTWDVIHVTGSCIGTLYLTRVMHMPYWKSALTLFTLGVAWEYFGDEFYRRGYYSSHGIGAIFDHRGFDKSDVFRNGFGIMISIPIR